MKKLYIIVFVFLSFFISHSNAYFEENIEKHRLEFEKILTSRYDFLWVNNDVLIRIDDKINLIISKISSWEIRLSKSEWEKLLWQIMALSQHINKTLDLKWIWTITVIDDKRCTNCMTDQLVEDTKNIPYLSSFRIVKKDFSNIWVETFLKSNQINYLPAIILSTNDIEDEGLMKPYLKELNNKQYFLEIWSRYNPFEIKSEKWFSVLDNETLQKIKSYSYLKWDKDAIISWLLYSDLECPYCMQLHNSDVENRIKETYGNDVNKYYMHFPLEFHKNAFSWALAFECHAKQKWATWFYDLIDAAYKNSSYDLNFLYSKAKELGGNESELKSCVESSLFKTKIEEIQALWQNTFHIYWTPWSILINNKTWEFEVILWAYPFETFKEVIDKLK